MIEYPINLIKIKNGFISCFQEREIVARKPGDKPFEMVGLKSWRGSVTLSRRIKFFTSKFNINRYFKGYSGDAFLTQMKGRTLNFVGSGPLKFKRRNIL